ncbi:hypothetical protein, partial [Pseudomonas chlororaphis]|uniref:hypothetical protein n=1 Tax=Pseudomonas chlororaphis TaxID=587753 RepID=UPI001EE6573A
SAFLFLCFPEFREEPEVTLPVKPAPALPGAGFTRHSRPNSRNSPESGGYRARAAEKRVKTL